MRLSHDTLQQGALPPHIKTPTANYAEQPEKVLQFGTGVLLRGLIDFFIDNANRQGAFNGRVVVVKSTDRGGADEFQEQDGLFTHVIRGIHEGKQIDETVVNSSISRVLSAKENWSEVISFAANPELKIIVSNTTEVGISLLEGDDVNATPPQSFPGKLLAVLQARYKAGLSGFVIIPTELIVDNAGKLKEIVLTLARQHKLEPSFINWIEQENEFCSSLVDRIVPGKLPDSDRSFDYHDDLAILSEPYGLWAIESSSPRVREILSFAAANQGVVIAPDIAKYRELKLRLLNGTHTMSCGVGVLAGIETVKDGMKDPLMARFVASVMMKELGPAITGNLISPPEAMFYGQSVLDRFKNPFIHHKWLSITLQYSSKMRLRNVPILLKHYEMSSEPPQMFALGFAAYILFMKSEKRGTDYIGNAEGAEYVINDDKTGHLHDLWLAYGETGIAGAVLKDTGLWGSDLSVLPGLTEAVSGFISLISSKGMRSALQSVL